MKTPAYHKQAGVDFTYISACENDLYYLYHLSVVNI